MHLRLTLQFLPFFILLFQRSPSPAAGVSSSKRNLFAWEWGDSRKFSLSSGSSGGAAHLMPQLLSRTRRVVAGSGLRQNCCCHSQGWLIHSAALGRSLWSKHNITHLQSNAVVQAACKWQPEIRAAAHHYFHYPFPDFPLNEGNKGSMKAYLNMLVIFVTIQWILWSIKHQ